jgi:rfaE bifunctional protein kinase chain/domain
MKTLELDALQAKVDELKQEGKRVVLCHGHFNVIHPGHLRILNFAKSKGDFLIVSILGDFEIDDILKDDFFPQSDRAAGVESLSMVDAVYSLTEKVPVFINAIKPDVYVKGREFENKRELIHDEIAAVENNSGEVIYSSGGIQNTTPKLFDETLVEQSKPSNKRQFLDACIKHGIEIPKIIDAVEKFNDLKILVIGDSIVDQFIACDTLGVSSEAPVLALRELESKEFVGGAGIVAQHIQSLGANCTYISVVGEDAPAQLMRDSFDNQGLQHKLFVDKDRPTTFKIRYIVENQKILRVSRLEQFDISKDIEERIIEELEKTLPNYDGIVVIDFVYGVITPNILKTITALSKKHDVKLFGDLQCSSQVGDVSKFLEFDLVTPTEKEARIAMRDYTSGLEKLARNLLEKTNSNRLVITLGPDGCLVYDKEGIHVFSEFFPALEPKPVDVAGAGDSMLSSYALSLCFGLDLKEASILASCAAAISINRLGNTPIKPEEVREYLKDLEKMKREILLCQH